MDKDKFILCLRDLGWFSYCTQASGISFVLLAVLGITGFMVVDGLTFWDVLGRGTLVCNQACNQSDFLKKLIRI